MSFLKQHARLLTLILVLIAGILITAPYANYQDYLSQGDHGRDLYAAQAVFRGELPYKDFWWVYGPLTPYYYGLFFKVFGMQISSMILGKLIIRILAGILICLAMMEISSEITAFLCACWFMLFHQDFFFTYNHLCGIAMVLGVAFCLLSYIKKNSPQKAFGALGFVFILCLIKINFGLATLVVSLLTVFGIDRLRRIPFDRAKKLFYLLSLIVLPLVVFLIYYSLLKGLSVMEIRQCLPYMDGDQPFSTTPWNAISTFLGNTLATIKSNWENFAFALIINASALRTFYLFAQKEPPSTRKTTLLLSMAMLVIFYVFNFHEYLKSGVWYRAFWSQPLSIMLSFLFIDIAAYSIPKTARKMLFSLLAYLLLLSWFLNFQQITAQKIESQYFSTPRGDIYIKNTPSWIATVKETTDFLNKTLKPNEFFFALPYDCLYYYLTNKKSPTRQLIFFEHIKIPLEQERSVIAQLEENHVNYVLISNRAFAHQELGLGLLGKTYCPLIGKYIQDNFVPITRFGDWTDEPGWAWNHGTTILRRKGIPRS